MIDRKFGHGRQPKKREPFQSGIARNLTPKPSSVKWNDPATSYQDNDSINTNIVNHVGLAIDGVDDPMDDFVEIRVHHLQDLTISGLNRIKCHEAGDLVTVVVTADRKRDR